MANRQAPATWPFDLALLSTLKETCSWLRTFFVLASATRAPRSWRLGFSMKVLLAHVFGTEAHTARGPSDFCQRCYQAGCGGNVPRDRTAEHNSGNYA